MTLYDKISSIKILYIIFFRGNSMVTDADVIITNITVATSGIGIQFYLHVLGQGGNTVLAVEELLAALNVRFKNY